MQTRLISVVALLAFAGHAQAFSLVQTESTGTITPGGGTVSLNFNDFDTGNGTRTLSSVTIQTTFLTWGGTYSAQNYSPSPETASLTVDMTANISASGALLAGATTTLDTTTSQHFTFAAAGQPGSSVSATVPATSASTAVEQLSNPSAFTGMGTFAIQYSSVNSVWYSYGGGNMYSALPAPYSSGQVTITYNYTGTALPAPEPSSIALLGMGGLVVALRRRFIKKV